MIVGEWLGQTTFPFSRSYTCGHCHQPVSSDRGYMFKDGGGELSSTMELRICHHCNLPSYFEEGQWHPAEGFGQAVAYLPLDVDDVWSEARRATAAGCYTAAVLVLRKLLMHIAVNLGAKAGQSFTSYVDFLASEHVIPPQANGWIGLIKDQGNEQNHEIKVANSEDARALMIFMEYLLRGLYAFPGELEARMKASSEGA